MQRLTAPCTLGKQWVNTAHGGLYSFGRSAGRSELVGSPFAGFMPARRQVIESRAIVRGVGDPLV